MTTTSPVAISRPVRMPAPLPRLMGWCTTLTHREASLSTISSVPSDGFIVNQDDFLLDRHGLNACDHRGDRVNLVEDGHDYGEFHGLAVCRSAANVFRSVLYGMSMRGN